MDSLEEYLYYWAHNNGTHHSILLSATRGMGKTVLLQKLAYRLGREWIRWKQRPLPVYFKFNKWKTSDDRKIIAKPREAFEEYLKDACINFNWDNFVSDVKNGRVILFLDGLDELTKVPEKDGIENIVNEILITFASEKAKIVISLRPELFQSKTKLFQVLPETKRLEKTASEKTCFYPVNLEFLTLEQINKYLVKRFGD